MIVNRFRTVLRKFDHLLLLVSLTLLVASPIWEKVFQIGYFLTESMTLVIIISGISVTYSHKNSKLNLKLYFGLIVAIISVISIFTNSGGAFEQFVQSIQVIYFLVLTIQLFSLIINSEKVNTEVLVNSVSGYFLIGLSWAIAIIIWTSSFPSSFSFSADGDLKFFDAIYYSFVTLTTLGYGDMLPISASAKAFSVLIAISGAFYTTIVLGMIVGKYISSESMKNLNKDK